MTSVKHCCVPGCIDSGEVKQPLHRFPNPDSDLERFNTWVYTIGGDIIVLENKFIFKHRRVCRRHFVAKYLCRNNRLSNIATPTLHIPGLDNLPVTEDLSSHTATQLYSDISTIKMMPSTSTHSIGKENLDPMIASEDISLAGLLCSETTTSEPIPSRSSIAVPERNLGEKPPRKSLRINKNQLYFTDTELQLRKQLIAVKVKLSKYKNRQKKQTAEIKAAKKFAMNPEILKTIENCSTIARLLMQIQWRENKKKVEGRRFTLPEKIAALSIMKQSAKAYRFLRKVFILPAPQTLVKLIQQSNIQPGINKNIFSQLKKKASKMDTTKKLCVVIYDEISIKANIIFNEKKDKITGFVDSGDRRLPEYANHAQVFMLRGLVHNYKQAIAYTFAASATKGPELAKQIKCVITNLQEAGFIVVATICDQATNNRHAIKLLQDETRGVYLRRDEVPKDKIILINNQEVIPIYDPPHLLKGIRNNLLNKDLHFTQNGITKVAKWSHLELLHKENPGFEGIRLMPKLTENHIIPDKINKMKVKFASQVLSRTVASNMGYLSDKGIIPKECSNTASLLLFMDNVFDSLNGSQKKNGNAKPLLKPATPSSLHHKTWSESIKVFKSMKFINSLGKVENVPSINNWVWTLEAVEILLKKINVEYGINSVWMRHLNQDPLENFFGAIRSHGCRNNNPTCDQFQSAFATLLINNLNSVHTQGKNCEKDYCDALHALVIDDNNVQYNCETTSTSSVDYTNLLTVGCPSIEAIKCEPKKIAPLQYISGYFLKKTKEKIFKDCDICIQMLMNKDPIDYIQYREYAGRRWLCSPSEPFLQLICDAQHITNEILKENLQNLNLKDSIRMSILMLADFNFISCDHHKKDIIDYLINFLTTFTIRIYCKNVNKILAGRLENYDDEDRFHVKAKKMYYMCCKRKHK